MGSSDKTAKILPDKKYITFNEAVAYLGKRKIFVTRLIRSGALRVKKGGRQGSICKQDVEIYKKVREDPDDTSSWEGFRALRIRLNIIDRKLDFLMRVCGLDVSMLRDADTETLIKIYDEACDFLEVDLELVTLPMMEHWAGIIINMTEIEIARLIEPCQDMEAWKPFHDLCQKMMSTLIRKKKFGTSNRMQETYRLLDKARKVIGQAAVIISEKMASKIGYGKRNKLFAIEARLDSLDRYIAEDIDL